jgi:hypothetical protein
LFLKRQVGNKPLNHALCLIKVKPVIVPSASDSNSAAKSRFPAGNRRRVALRHQYFNLP